MNVMKALTGIIALSRAVSGVSGCGGSHEVPAEKARKPIAVTVDPVTTVDTAERLEAGGIVAAEETAAVSSRIVATIVSVRVKAGDRVRAGDMLVALDARDVIEHTQQARANALAAEKSLAQARTEQSAAEAEHRLATVWRMRIAALHARNSATDQERDEADARLTAAAARVAGARAAIELADANLGSARAAVGAATATESYTALRAPFDGLITERLTDSGNLAEPGVPLLRIESDGARQVLVRVDEARAAYVHPGDTVDIEIDGIGESVPGAKALEGVVAEVARAVGADQRAFTVKVTVPRTVTARSGTFARVVFRGRPRRALLVPTQAIQRYGQVSSVYVVQDGVARLRLVQTGPSSAAGTEILAGLDVGESVVTSPTVGVADGARVAVDAARKPSGVTP
jgi:multidrug efflux pump subunit AcrA (membrane-fusion protein)